MLLNFTNICAQTAKKYVPERKKARNSKLHKIPRTRRILMRRRTKVNKQLASRITRHPQKQAKCRSSGDREETPTFLQI